MIARDEPRCLLYKPGRLIVQTATFKHNTCFRCQRQEPEQRNHGLIPCRFRRAKPIQLTAFVDIHRPWSLVCLEGEVLTILVASPQLLDPNLAGRAVEVSALFFELPMIGEAQLKKCGQLFFRFSDPLNLAR